MASVKQRSILIGNLGRDPGGALTRPAALAVCNVTLRDHAPAGNPGVRAKKGVEERPNGTASSSTTASRRSPARYLKKGRSIYVEGRLKDAQMDRDKDGCREVPPPKVIAQDMRHARQPRKAMGGRARAAGGTKKAAATASAARAGRSGSAPAIAAAGNPPSRPAPKSATGFDNMDDDIPF